MSQGIAVVQCMRNGQHSLVALCLVKDPSSSGQMAVHELGTLDLVREASCIGNVILSPDMSTAVVVIGTYSPTIMILEIALPAAALCNTSSTHSSTATGWKVLGEMSIASCNPSSGNETSAAFGAQWAPGSPLAAARFPQRDIVGAALPASVVVIATPPPPFTSEEVHKAQMTSNSLRLQSGTGKTREESITQGDAIEEMSINNPVEKEEESEMMTSTSEELSGSKIFDYRITGLELWVSTRSGEIHMLHVLPPTISPASQHAKHAQWEISPTFHHRGIKHSNLPPVLCLLLPLPRATPRFTALAISDRTSLLQRACGGASIQELGLHLPGTVCSAPLILSTPSGGERLFLFSASDDGALSLASLEAHQMSRVMTHPLPWHAEHIAAHDNIPGLVAVAGKKRVRLSPHTEEMTFAPQLAMVDQSTGRITASTAGVNSKSDLQLGEKITNVALLPAQPWPEKDFQCFVLASTALQLPAPRQGISRPIKGRLLLFGWPSIKGENHTLHLLEVVQMPEAVTALTVASSSISNKRSNSSSAASIDIINGTSTPTRVGATAAASPPAAVAPSSALGLREPVGVFVAIGRRIAAYEYTRWSKDRPKGARSFRKLAWASVNAPVDALRVDPGQEITWVYSASQEGAIIYHYTPTSEPLDPGVIDEEAGPPELDLDTFSPSADSVVDVSMISSDVLALGKSGGLTVFANDIPWTAMQPSARVNFGDAGVALVAPERRDKAVLAITRGGGIAEVIEVYDHHGIKPLSESYKMIDLLTDLQEAILKHPEFRLNIGASEFLYMRIDDDTLRPINEVFTHPVPKEELVGRVESPEMSTTAEGPLPPAIVIEQPSLQHLLSEKKAESKTTVLNEKLAYGMLYGEVLKLFLEAPRKVQHELVAVADQRDYVLPGQTIEAKTAAVCYVLSSMGVHML